MPVSVVLLSPGAANTSQLKHLTEALARMKGCSTGAPEISFRHVDADLEVDQLVEHCQGAIALLVHAKYPLYVMFFAADFPVFAFTGLLWWWAVKEQRGQL